MTNATILIPLSAAIGLLLLFVIVKYNDAVKRLQDRIFILSAWSA